jgi:hypothetical protein
MGWGTRELQQFVPDLQALSLMKYDEYGNYGPGIKFVENLAAWLDQFAVDERQIALDFVMDELVFVSNSELAHLVSLVPLEVLRPVIRTRIGEQLDIPRFRIAAIEATAEFQRLMRSSLIIGASDGAKLDQLRRASSELSHEQFIQGTEPDLHQLERLARKLAKRFRDGDTNEGDDESALSSDQVDADLNVENATTETSAIAPFEHVFFVDDFSGSGRTLLRKDDGEPWDGKLIRLRDHLVTAAQHGYVVPDVPGTIVLYFASEKAQDHLADHLAAAGFSNWTVEVVAELPSSRCIDRTNAQLAELCNRVVDPTTEDKHKGLAPLGYSDCALPLVLAHNTPNNSICVLWMDTRDEIDPRSTRLKALFPRFERHHKDRQ